MTTHTQKGSLEVKGEWCQGMLYPQAFAVESMGGSWDAQNMDCEPGKSEWLAKGNLKEMSHKSNSNCHKDATQQHGLWVHLCVRCQSVQVLNCVRFFATQWTAAHQASLSVTNLLKLGLLSYGAYSNSCPLSRWCHPTISPSVVPSPPTFNLSQHQGLFEWVSSSYQVAKILEFQLQHQSFQWTPRTDFL